MKDILESLLHLKEDNTQDKVFVVEYHWYGDDRDESDYGGTEVVGVFSTEEDAKEAVKKTGYPNMYYINEVPFGGIKD
jgi:hypothetical protein